MISTYGLEISSPSTSMTTSACRRASGSASSSAVRNWLETSPRTRIGAAEARARPPAGRERAAADSPAVPRYSICAAELRAARRPGRRSAARACAATPRSSKRAPSARPAARARRPAAASPCPRCRGRASRSCSAQPAAEAVDRRARCAVALDAAAQLRAARRASRACRRNRAGRAIAVVPAAQAGEQQDAVRDALRARQRAPCRAAPRSGGMSRKRCRQNIGARRVRAGAIQRCRVAASRERPSASRRAPRWRCGSGLRAPRRCRS